MTLYKAFTGLERQRKSMNDFKELSGCKNIKTESELPQRAKCAGFFKRHYAGVSDDLYNPLYSDKDSGPEIDVVLTDSDIDETEYIIMK